MSVRIGLGWPRALAAVVFAILASSLLSPARAQVTTLNFDTVSTPTFVEATAYLSGFGVTLAGVTPGTTVVIANDAGLYGGVAIEPPSAPNVLTQNGSNDPISFTLVFSSSVDSVRFTRPKLIAGPSGVTHPEWRATALSQSGTTLSTVSEGLLGSFSDIPAREFVLAGPGIRSVRFDSNNHHFAAFSGVLIDDLELEARPLNLACTPGEVIPVRLAAQFRGVNLAKGVLVHYGNLDLDFTVQPPSFGAICSSVSNEGALPVNLLFLASPPLPVAVRSVTTATLTVFEPNATGPLSACDFSGYVVLPGVTNGCILNGRYDSGANYVRWQSNGFRTQLAGWDLPFNTGPLTYYVAMQGIGLSGDTSMAAVVAAADTYIHNTLIDNLPAIAWYTFVQDPGNVTLSLSDELGRSTGIVGGNLLRQIPGSFYVDSPTNPVVVLTNPVAGRYSIGVTGTNTGDYDLSVAVVDMKKPNDPQQAAVTGEIQQGETISYSMDFQGLPDTSLIFSGQFDGGGQRPKDVNKLLTYANITGSPVQLSLGATSFALNIIYGRTADPATFGVKLNGVDISSQFVARPGMSQMVPLSLARGRNVLELEIQGLVGTRMVSDRDRLVFMVP